ncbi:MAG TPA: DEAD/DEAH box helicase [Ruminiclostridium sp.]
MDYKNEPIEFNKTTFCKGLNATFSKVAVKLEIYLDFLTDGKFMKLGLFVGMDKMYRVIDIGHFLETMEGSHSFHFSKNFMFEPNKMHFERNDIKILDFLSRLKVRRKYSSSDYDYDSEKQELYTSEIGFDEAEGEAFLDYIWEDLGSIRLCNQSDKFKFENDISIKIKVEKKDGFNLLTIDYSERGDFEPLSLDFKYIIFKDKKLVVNIPVAKRELFINLYNFKNGENIVSFRVEQNENKLFQKNFIEKYTDEFKIILDSAVKKEMLSNSLISKIYFDVADKGIVSKIEFCYADMIINPLDDVSAKKNFREFDCERKVISELELFGFRKNTKLFLLDDAEKIMNLLTNKLVELKKIAEVYYSEDFKKLYVKSLSGISLSLSEDGSIIHMNINLENVSDEELIELLGAMKSGKKYYRLKSGSIINLNSIESSKVIDLINSLGLDTNSIKDGLLEIPLNRSLYIDNYLREHGIETLECDPRLSNLITNISTSEVAEIELDETLLGILRNYQLVGVKWLKSMASYSFGGILADDMGLGKTLQVLAFIVSETQRKLPCIVVAPTSIIYNWKREAAKFTPQLKVLVITGPKDRRNLLINASIDFDLIITSYGALKNDVEEYKKIIFSYVFVDEAQNIKNPLTLNANSVKSIKAKCCFALTGTPIENRLTELWSIFEFIMPGYLYDKNKFINTFEDPIIREKNTAKMEELSKMIKPFIIRRMKKAVLSELPDKIETNYFTEMTEKQKKLYVAYYKNFKDELIAQINESGTQKNHIEILTALTRLRQICAHPSTFLDNYDGGSGKLDLAMEIIKESINSGHSVLLFSQFTKMLKIIRDELENNNINYYYLDGTMKPEERVIEIDNFSSDKEAVFLISLKAGGTGLNLIKADIIIHFDPWWNPAVEDQASDRAHRIGQKNVVQVYKLLTEGTIEEKIAQLQERKRDLIGSILKPGETFLNSLSEAEIRELFQ